MQRRKFLIGAGSIATGTAAAMGTGAFTSVTASRDVTVEVAGDSSAYLALQKAAGQDGNDPGKNSDAFVNTSGDEVSFNFNSGNSTTNLGDGFNPDSVTEIQDLIEVVNQGTQSVYLSVDLANLDISDGSGNNAYVGLAVRDDETTTSDLNANIAFDSGSGTAHGGEVPDPSSDGAYELSEGESVHLDLTVDTTDFTATNVETTGSVTFIADQSSSL